MNLIEKFKTKILVVIIVILTSLLSATYIDRGIVIKKYDDTKSTLTQALSSNERLTKQNESLASDLKKQPKEVIKIVREVEKELCKSELTQQAIKNIKSKKEVTDEKDVADIDDRLPADLIQLLK